MEFGQIENIDGADLSLPPDHPNTKNVLQKNRSNSQVNIFVGLPISTHKDWAGTLYPSKPKNELLSYAEQFNSLEANSTGYGTPTPATINKWINDTPEGFKFCPKIPQNISRSASLMNTTSATEKFCSAVKLAGNKLGISFLQMSDNFAPKRLSDLVNYLDAFPKDVPLAVELRQEDWFKDKTVFDEITGALEANNMSLVITDAAGRRDILHQRLTNGDAFIRFNANDLHTTDFTRMDEWVLRLKTWIEAGIKNIYFFVHTDSKQLNPILSNYMIAELNKHCGLQLKACNIFDEAKLRATATSK